MHHAAHHLESINCKKDYFGHLICFKIQKKKITNELSERSRKTVNDNPVIFNAKGLGVWLYPIKTNGSFFALTMSISFGSISMLDKQFSSSKVLLLFPESKAFYSI